VRTWPVAAINIGTTRPLGHGLLSGIAKAPTDTPNRLLYEGFAGDEQGDRKHHGGPEKAVHHYPAEHYAAWQAEIGDHPLLRGPAAFGENITAPGFVEDDVAIGDRFRLGGALIQVSQGRQPCFRLNLRFEVHDMALRMQKSGRTGWYYRVVEEGQVDPDATLALVDRCNPAWTIGRLRRILYMDVLNRSELHAMVSAQHLPERWRHIAEQRLRTTTVENWHHRLFGF
jgi:MOSC domain-containing protein YiiM